MFSRVRLLIQPGNKKYCVVSIVKKKVEDDVILNLPRVQQLTEKKKLNFEECIKSELPRLSQHVEYLNQTHRNLKIKRKLINDTFNKIETQEEANKFKDEFYVKYIKEPEELLKRIYPLISEDLVNNTTKSVGNLKSFLKIKFQRKFEPDTREPNYQLVSLFNFFNYGDDRARKFAAEMQNCLSQELPDVQGLGIVAPEGFNGQFQIPFGEIEAFEKLMQAKLQTDDLDFNYHDRVHIDKNDIQPYLLSNSRLKLKNAPFGYLKIEYREQIINDGIENTYLPSLIYEEKIGTALTPKEWHEKLTEKDDHVVIDCRNDYESDIGHFDKAIPLNTNTFTDTWSAIDEVLQSIPKEKDIMTYCTGGVRCIKVNAYLHSKGYKKTFSLKHGILGYKEFLRDANEFENSKFIGQNYVFDKRMIVEVNKI